MFLPTRLAEETVSFLHPEERNSLEIRVHTLASRAKQMESYSEAVQGGGGCSGGINQVVCETEATVRGCSVSP